MVFITYRKPFNKIKLLEGVNMNLHHMMAILYLILIIVHILMFILHVIST